MKTKTLLIIPGLPRCATTTVANLLRQHEGIFVPRFKEPHSLLGKDYIESKKIFDGNNYISLTEGGLFLNEEQYFKNYYKEYNNDKVECLVDASTLYSCNLNFLDNIKLNFPELNVKFLVLYRDPWKRATSHYRFSRTRGEEPRSFKEALNDEFSKQREDWIMKGYAYGSREDILLDHLIRKFGEDSVRIHQLGCDGPLDQKFMDLLVDFIGLKRINFNFEVYKNSASYEVNGVHKIIRIFARKTRGLSPCIFDNKVTRYFFHKYLEMQPKKTVDKDEFIEEIELFNKCYKSYGEDKVNKNIYSSLKL